MPESQELLHEQYSSSIYIEFDESVELDETEEELGDLELKGVVADVGCGYGGYLSAFRPTWDLYIGIEPNRHCRELAKKCASELGLRCEFVDGKAEKLPLESNSVDTVLCTYVLSELATVKKVRKALKEMRRVAKPGADLILCDLTGGDEDGWNDLVNVAEVARGELPSREQADVWIEVFAFLNKHARIDYMERLDIIYKFKDLDDAYDKFRALVPDLGTNPDVTAAVRRHFREPILETEGFMIQARLKR